MKSENATPQDDMPPSETDAPNGTARTGRLDPAGVAPNTQHSEGEPLWMSQLIAGLPESTHGTIRGYVDQLRAQLEEARRERLAARGAALRAGFRSGSLAEIIEVLSGRALAAEAALREATNKSLEEAAKLCEKVYKHSTPTDDRFLACARAIRSLKTPPVEG